MGSSETNKFEVALKPEMYIFLHTSTINATGLKSNVVHVSPEVKAPEPIVVCQSIFSRFESNFAINCALFSFP